MESARIAIIASTRDRLSSLAEQLEHNLWLYLPDQPSSQEHERIITQLLDYQPAAIALELQSGRDYQDFIKQVKQRLEHEQPLFVGLIDKAEAPLLISELARLALDSFQFIEHAEVSLRRTSELHQHRLSLQHELQNSNNTAYIAMKAASEIGLLIQLVERLNGCHTSLEAVFALFGLCARLELKALCAQVDYEGNLDFQPHDMVNDTARKVLSEALQSKIRILSKNRIVVFRYDYLVLMIINAPWADEATYGRMRDVLCQATALTEARLKAISLNKLVHQQHEQVESIMGMIKRVSSEAQIATRNIMNNLSSELHEISITFDFTEEQEQKLTELSEKALDAMEELHESNAAISEHFKTLVESIKQSQAISRLHDSPQADQLFQDPLQQNITLF